MCCVLLFYFKFQFYGEMVNILLHQGSFKYNKAYSQDSHGIFIFRPKLRMNADIYNWKKNGKKHSDIRSVLSA